MPGSSIEHQASIIKQSAPSNVHQAFSTKHHSSNRKHQGSHKHLPRHDTSRASAAALHVAWRLYMFWWAFLVSTENHANTWKRILSLSVLFCIISNNCKRYRKTVLILSMPHATNTHWTSSRTARLYLSHRASTSNQHRASIIKHSASSITHQTRSTKHWFWDLEMFGKVRRWSFIKL